MKGTRKQSKAQARAREVLKAYVQAKCAALGIDNSVYRGEA
jgi:hypothetical protein